MKDRTIVMVGFTVALVTATVLGYLDADRREAERNKVTPVGTFGTYVKPICDEASGVQYLIYDETYRGGMTVRVNADGTPMRCNGVNGVNK